MNLYYARNRNLTQHLGFFQLTLITGITVAPTIGMIVYMIVRDSPEVSWNFLARVPHDGMLQGGIMPAIALTFYLTTGTALFSVPLGMAAAVYLPDYAADNALTHIVRLAILNLAGIPSVVQGLFGLGLFVLFLKFGTIILAAALTL